MGRCPSLHEKVLRRFLLPCSTGQIECPDQRKLDKPSGNIGWEEFSVARNALSGIRPRKKGACESHKRPSFNSIRRIPQGSPPSRQERRLKPEAIFITPIP